MKVLVVDVGGSHVKMLAAGESQSRRFDSGPSLTARQMVAGVKKLTKDWTFDAVSIGYPGPVLDGRPVAEPVNLGSGWVGLDYERAFGCRVQVVNDAAMQAIGSYQGGKMLFLGLGTGLGTTLIIDGIVEPMELGHLPYKKGTYEDYVGQRGLAKHGLRKWRRNVAEVVKLLSAALRPQDIVLGGGNVKHLKQLPEGCRAGANVNAFIGGLRLWEHDTAHPITQETVAESATAKRGRQGTKKKSAQKTKKVTTKRATKKKPKKGTRKK
ncbi:MAG: ROK family protein [Pirellulales bacterium]